MTVGVEALVDQRDGDIRIGIFNGIELLALSRGFLGPFSLASLGDRPRIILVLV